MKWLRKTNWGVGLYKEKDFILTKRLSHQICIFSNIRLKSYFPNQRAHHVQHKSFLFPAKWILEVFDSLTIFLKCFHEFRGSIWNSFFQLLDLAIESWYYSFRFKKKENMFFLWLNRAFGISIWIGDWEF